MKMFVSRKDLPLIQLVSGVLAVNPHIFSGALHQGVVLLQPALAAGELLQPLAEGGIQGSALIGGGPAGLLDEVFVGAEGNVLHEFSVHESRVMILGKWGHFMSGGEHSQGGRW